MTAALMLVCVAALLAASIAAIVLARSKLATPLVYGAACLVSAVALVGAVGQVILPTGDAPSIVTGAQRTTLSWQP